MLYLSKIEKRAVFRKVTEQMKSNKLIKDNNSMIRTVIELRQKIRNIDDNRGMSVLSFINELILLQNTIHKFMVKVNNNCYKCKNCNFTFFTKVKTQKKKCGVCSSNKIVKIRLD